MEKYYLGIIAIIERVSMNISSIFIMHIFGLIDQSSPWKTLIIFFLFRIFLSVGQAMRQNNSK